MLIAEKPASSLSFIWLINLFFEFAGYLYRYVLMLLPKQTKEMSENQENNSADFWYIDMLLIAKQFYFLFLLYMIYRSILNSSHTLSTNLKLSIKIPYPILYLKHPNSLPLPHPSNHQPTTTHDQTPPTNHHPPPTQHQPPPTHHQPPTTNLQNNHPPPTHHQPPTTHGHPPPTTHHPRPTNHHPPPKANTFQDK